MGIARRLAQLVPQRGLARQIALRSFAYAIGTGAFYTGSAVYFTKILHFTAAEVAFGISLSALVALGASVPLGVLGDRITPRVAWCVFGLAEACLFLVYPLIESNVALWAVLSGVSVSQGAGNAARSAYIIEVAGIEGRARVGAHSRTALNLGYAIGALLAAAALATPEYTLLRGFPILTSLLLMVASLSVLRMRKKNADTRESSENSRRLPNAPRQQRWHPSIRTAILILTNGLLAAHDPILFVVLPLWIATSAHLPNVTIALTSLINTGAVILLQVPLANGVSGITAGARAGLRAGVALLSGCLLLLGAEFSRGVLLAIVLTLAGAAVFSIAEVLQSTSSWAMSAGLSVDGKRSEFQGWWSIGTRLTEVVVPTTAVALLAWSPAGWAIMAGAFLMVGCVQLIVAHGLSRTRPDE